MLHIREDPIHCIDDKCIYPSRKNIDHLPKTHNYNDLYGAEDYSKGRFKDLGIPIFIMKVSGNSNESVQEEKMHIQQLLSLYYLSRMCSFLQLYLQDL